MSEIKTYNNINATDEQFLHFINKSSLGYLLIQYGRILYFNKRFCEIFGYSKEEISTWKKREFYKIVHPDDLANLTQKLMIDNQNVITIRFRGIRKEGHIIPIENYVCIVSYNNKKAMLSSYMVNNNPIEDFQKIILNIPTQLYKKLELLSKIKEKTIEGLIIQDLENLIKFYKEQFSSINLKF